MTQVSGTFNMTGDHHGPGAARATLLVRAVDAILGTHRSAGRLEEALPLYERTLAERERVLGADHPDTLTSRDYLAGAYRSAGRLSQAIPLYEQTLAQRERVLGADHPDTLASRNKLEHAQNEARSC